MNIVPVASQSNGEDENDNYDEADIFEILVRGGTTRPVAFTTLQYFEHRAIVIEQMPIKRRACEGRRYPPAGWRPGPRKCHCRRQDEILRNPQPTCDPA